MGDRERRGGGGGRGSHQQGGRPGDMAGAVKNGRGLGLSQNSSAKCRCTNSRARDRCTKSSTMGPLHRGQSYESLLPPPLTTTTTTAATTQKHCRRHDRQQLVRLAIVRCHCPLQLSMAIAYAIFLHCALPWWRVMQQLMCHMLTKAQRGSSAHRRSTRYANQAFAAAAAGGVVVPKNHCKMVWSLERIFNSVHMQ